MEEIVQIAGLEGALSIPNRAKGIVLFAHGSGSSRHSPRNNFVASVLNKSGLATLLIDLLTPEEEAIYETRFDIDLLTTRLETVVEWLETKNLSIGLFGSSTGSAAALEVAADLGDVIKAVVSRGGRVDMATDALGDVWAPTFFIVGSEDPEVLKLNQKAFEVLVCPKKMEIIPGAGHLFEEPGCLEEVAKASAEWFKKYL
jgi:putative phosphoribosyl transferase